jgi:hypothetical protein
MATHDYNIANQTGANFRSDLNNALAAIVSNNYGSTDPATVLDAAINGQCQWWADAATGLLKLRNTGDTDWVVVGELNAAYFNFTRSGRATAQASTSGTAINFHDIPSWANRVTMLLNGVSTDASDTLIVQLGTGTSGSPTWVTSGYNSNVNSSGSTSSVYSSVGFLLETSGSSSFLRSGIVNMCRIDGNNWVYSSSIKQAAVAGITSNDIGAGNSGNLGAVLTQVRLLTDGSPDTFDAGTVNIFYES